MQRHFRMMAAYNRWANLRLYAAAAQLDDASYRRDSGVFFGSLHGTLNHLLVADRVWMRRLDGAGEQPRALNQELFAELGALRSARAAEDARIIGYVDLADAARLQEVLEYRTLNGTPQRQPIHEILAHMFNHQSHHRGQAHAALTRLGIAEPPSLDLLIMQRELACATGAP